jgi:hypothetical protein
MKALYKARQADNSRKPDTPPLRRIYRAHSADASQVYFAQQPV